MQKTFVLDTNVLLHSPQALFSFADNLVVIPIKVLEELDSFKSHSDEMGRNARHINRQLDKLRANGKLSEGVPINKGGMLKIELPQQTDQNPLLDLKIADNSILLTALQLQNASQQKVYFVSKDINARIKADALGLEAQDFEGQKVDFDSLYKGWLEVELPPEDIDKFFKEKTLTLKLELLHNQFLLMRDSASPKRSALGKYDEVQGCIVPLFHADANCWGITPLNVQQRFAMELLFCNDVSLVSLVGSAGTGKTLLALAVGLQKVVDEREFRKLLVSRPIMPLGRDIGYLPGSKEEKLGHWMQPIFDNLRFIMDRKSKTESEDQINYLREAKMLEMEAVTYIRGRSIPRQYIIIDEAQNLTPHEVKTIISRAGQGTKMILTGDAQQIDNPYLDSDSNGLTYLVERFKGKRLFGHITLVKSERSKLASLAAELL